MPKYQFMMIALAVLLFSSIGCFDDDIRTIPDKTDGLKPVYIQNDDWKIVSIEAPRSKRDLDGTFQHQSTEYIREVGEGLHVVDISDPLIPTPLSFISIPGIHRVDIRGDSMVVGNYLDAVILAIGDAQNIKIGRRVENVHLVDPLSKLPDSYRGFFECPDESNGTIIGWRRDEILSPQCWN